VARMLLFEMYLYYQNKKVIILYIEVIRSALTCHCKEKKYIPLPIFNSDDVVMSCENQNFHLCLFVKGGALQLWETADSL